MTRGQAAKQDGPNLVPVDVDWNLEEAIPDDVEAILGTADEMLQSYWDQWHRRPLSSMLRVTFATSGEH